jgi:hypothetical protein
MNFPAKAAIALFASALTLTCLPAAESVKVDAYPSNQWWRSEIRLHVPATAPVGLLVFLPAGDIHSFTEARFPKMLATNGVMTDGSHNPHSWSIVDERDLTQWLTDRLRKSGSQ